MTKIKAHYRTNRKGEKVLIKAFKRRLKGNTKKAYYNEVLKVLLSQKRINRDLVLKTINTLVG